MAGGDEVIHEATEWMRGSSVAVPRHHQERAARDRFDGRCGSVRQACAHPGARDVRHRSVARRRRVWPRTEAVDERHKGWRVDLPSDSSTQTALGLPELPRDEIRRGGDIRHELDRNGRAVGVAPVGDPVEGLVIERDDHVGFERSYRHLARETWLSEVKALCDVEHREAAFHVSAYEVVRERARPVQGLDVRFAREQDDDRTSRKRRSPEW